MPRHIERVKHKHTTKIDGVRVEIGSAKWEAFSCKWRYYRFLEALTRNAEVPHAGSHILSLEDGAIKETINSVK